MSDNYKVIRRTREAVRELKAEAWGQAKIAKHIGVSSAIIGDLLEMDEVAQDLRKPTIDKFRKFLDKRGAAKQHFKDEESKNLPPIPAPPEAFLDKPPLYDGKKKDTTDGSTGGGSVGGLLAELTELSVRFVACGYRLNASLTMIHQPE